jgi:uncharacterized protein
MPEEDAPSAKSPAATARIPDTSMEEIIASISRIIAEDSRATAASLVPPAVKTGILELTDMIEPDGSIKKLPAAAAPDIGSEGQAAAPAQGEPATARTEAVAPEAGSRTTPSAPVAETAAAAFGRLAAVVRDRRAAPDLALGAGGRTLEDVVRDALDPLLRAWLDERLPAIVERLVREEIQRVVREAGLG